MPRDESEQIRQAFSMIDKDGSGKISSDELKNILKSIGEKLSDEEVDEIMRDIDLNGDGELDCDGQEIRFMLSMMFKIDQNRNYVFIEYSFDHLNRHNLDVNH